MLEHLFGSKTRLRLLQLFYGNQERAFFMRELSRIADTQLNAIRREIENLEELGIIKEVERGSSKIEEVGTERSKYYKLNKEFYLNEELGNLLSKTQLMEEKSFVEAIHKRAGNIKMLVLTGFFTNEADSSTDMLIVGEIKTVQLAKIIRDFEKFLNRQIRYTIMEEKEFNERREIGDKFLYGVFESKHVFVINEYKLS
jgi:predicted metalloendopeptidase